MRYLWLWVIVFVLAESAQTQGSREATAASYLDRGNSWATKGELDRAIADFNLALQFDPRFAGAYHNRAVALAKKGKWNAALADVDRAIQVDPRLVAAYVGRGGIRFRKGDLDGMLSDSAKRLSWTLAWLSHGTIAAWPARKRGTWMEPLRTTVVPCS